MNKKPLYEYIDLIDSRNKLSEIEKKAKKNDIISWKILVDEIKKDVIIDEDIKDFISKTEKNIYISND